MRKRLVIGAIATVVIGVAAGYFLSRPGKGSAEYHKTQYLHFRTQGSHWTDMRIVPQLVRSWHQQSWIRQQEFHERALLGLGYLKQVSIAASNSVWLFGCIPPDLKLDDRFAADIVAFTTVRRVDREGAVSVVAPATSVEQVADVVREAYKADGN